MEHSRVKAFNVGLLGVRLFRLGAVIILSLAALALIVSLSMHRDFDHDENQFVASGAMLARQALLPYRDYGYFHTPNLVFVYAAIFHNTDHLLLSARLFSSACAWLTGLTLAAAVFGIFRRHGRPVAWLAAIAAVLALLSSPLFTSACGLASNHDVSTLLALWAFLLALRAGKWRRPSTGFVLAGFLLGLAIGTRLTFAPAAAALLGVIYITPGQRRTRRGVWMILFTLALAVALLPSFWLLAMAPRQLLFGNLVYPHLNTVYHQVAGYPRAMTWTGKFIYPFKDLLPKLANIPLAIAFCASLLALKRSWRDQEQHPQQFEMRATILMIAGLLVGTFAPTPLFAVYFYATVPFAIVFVALVAADARKPAVKIRHWHIALSTLTAVACVISAVGIEEYRQVGLLARADQWVPMQLHAAGLRAHELGAASPVLTLVPIIPLEAGLRIYPELATGPFSVRAAGQLTEAQEEQFRIMDEADCIALLATSPPPCLLTGFEHGFDSHLHAAAKEQGFEEVSFTCLDKTLSLQVSAGASGVKSKSH